MFRGDSIDEMKDADSLIERILYLEGVPNMQRLGAVRVGETVAEKLKLALDVESEAILRLNAGIAACVEVGDNGSRELLEGVLTGEEEHAGLWFARRAVRAGERSGRPLACSTASSSCSSSV